MTRLGGEHSLKISVFVCLDRLSVKIDAVISETGQIEILNSVRHHFSGSGPAGQIGEGKEQDR